MQVPVLKNLAHLLDQVILSGGQASGEARSSCLIIEQVRITSMHFAFCKPGCRMQSYLQLYQGKKAFASKAGHK